MELNELIALNLFRLRKINKLSQHQVGNLVGVSRESVQLCQEFKQFS